MASGRRSRGVARRSKVRSEAAEIARYDLAGQEAHEIVFGLTADQPARHIVALQQGIESLPEAHVGRRAAAGYSPPSERLPKVEMFRQTLLDIRAFDDSSHQ